MPRASMHLLRRWRPMLAIAAVLTLGGLTAAARNAPARPDRALELREKGHDPAVRWTASGDLCMVFVRDEPGGGRLYFASARTTPGPPVAVSPAATVVAHSQTPPCLEALPDGTLVAVYAVSTTSAGTTEIRAQRSLDGGTTWSDPVRVNDDHAPGPHGWISTAVGALGRMQIVWLDARGGQQGLVWTQTADGARFAPNRVLDPRVCFCCATKSLAGANGRVWIAYRDLEGKDLRNISIVTADARGSFGSPVTVSQDGWHLDGCPDSGPSLASDATGGLWAAWFNGAAPGVYAAFSSDGGASFAPRTLVASGSDGSPANHPEIAVLADGRVVTAYVARSAIFASVWNPRTKSWSGAVRLAEAAADPRIASRSGRPALSYTARDGNGTLAIATTTTFDSLGAIR
jgi:hypothetical protein